MTVSFRTNSATIDQLSEHLRRCDDGFIPPLSDRVVIDEYARKIAAQATRFEAWSNGGLVGLVAVYLPGPNDEPGFITNVSVVPELRGHRVASALLAECAAFARRHDIRSLRLEVDRRNDPAVGLYEASGFQQIELVGETITMERPADGQGVDR
jgi:ribosomal protein S18 acetylase RimI-like enzyme